MSSLSQLSLEQRNALEARLLAKGKAAPLPKAQESNPLTAAQESLWVAEQLAPGQPLYNIPLAFRVSGPLQTALLQQSWLTVLRRHQALRLRVKLIEQRPWQQERADLDFPFTLEKLGERNLDELLAEEARRPFDLTKDWLARCRLVEISANEHVLALTLHHIIADNHSLAILLREVSLCYGALARGENPALRADPPQFPDVAAFLTAKAGGRGRDEHVEFWRQRAGETPDDRSARRKNVAGDWRPVSIPTNIAASLKDLARNEQATLYMTLLTAFGILWNRETGAETVVVGAPVSQRDYPGSELTIGLLIHTVPLRLSFAGDPSFRELLARVKAEAIACFRHAHASGPFPPFDTVFQLVDASAESLQLAGTTVRDLPTRTGTSKFDLTFTLADGRDGLRGNMEFAHAAIDASTVDRWIERYGVLLKSILQAPDAPISELPLLSAEERHLVVTEWNRTKTKYPRDATIHQLFEDQARSRPSAKALVFEDQALTYGELEQRANRVAAGLRQKGVTPGGFVGICLERSPELIIGLLGILKAGAAYVPLDPDYPAERLDYMKRDAGVQYVLTRGDEILAPGEDGPVPPPAGAPDAAAYVIYTSGSTGQPKGAVVPHRAVVRLVKETNYAAFGPNEVFLQFAPTTFDASTFEIWGALLNGATLAIYPPGFESLSQFGAVLRRHGVTTLWLTAGLFHQMVENDLESLRGLRQILAGGDVLSPTCVKTVLRALPGCRLINGYGPTENTTFSCCYTLPSDWDGASVPIGPPISNTRAYIVDKKMNPTGIGTPGELCVGGDGLALGYLNQPELTARKFVPDPFSGEPGARLYRTGDLARYTSDGTIEFLGRMDQQVKIRGFRVELGEVEEALRRHPAVAQAAAVAREDATQTKQLVAYLVARPDQVIDTTEVRRFLRESLPAHLIPSRFFVLENLPLTANGKVDRRRLPSDNAAASPGALTPPRTDTERKLAEIWRELLGFEKPGIEQNFFELGGHSLLAMRLQNRVFTALGANVPLRDVFEHPTIASLAERIGRTPTQPAHAPAPIPRRPRRRA